MIASTRSCYWLLPPLTRHNFGFTNRPAIQGKCLFIRSGLARL